MSSTVRGTKAFRKSKWDEALADSGGDPGDNGGAPEGTSDAPTATALKKMMQEGPPAPDKKNLVETVSLPALAEEKNTEGGNGKQEKKYTMEAIEQRRRTVLEMTMRGITASTIAQQLGVHRNTIVSDLRAIRDQNREAMERADVLEEIGGAARFYDMIQQESMYGMTTNRHPMVKVSFLSLAMKAQAEKLNLMTKVGILPDGRRKETRPSGVILGDGIDLDRMTPEELKRFRDRILDELYATRDGEVTAVDEDHDEPDIQRGSEEGHKEG